MPPASTDTDATDASVGDAAAPMDATLDVTLAYADAARLWGYEDASYDSATATTEAGGPTGPTLDQIWPLCGCDDTNSPESTYEFDGGVALIGACASVETDPDASFAWTGSTTCDDDLRYDHIGSLVQSGKGIGDFPPCCALYPRTVDAGATPLQPPAPANTSAWLACAALWTCMVNNGLYSISGRAGYDDNPIGAFFCGSDTHTCANGGGAHGPCANETFAAFELANNTMNATTIVSALGAFKMFEPGDKGYPAAGPYGIANAIWPSDAQLACSLDARAQPGGAIATP
jgi:hypothetical protein